MPRKPKATVSEAEKEGDSALESPSPVSEETKTPEPVKEPEVKTPEQPSSEAPKEDLGTPQSVTASDLAGMTSTLPEPNRNAIDAYLEREGESTPDKPKSGSGIMSKNGKEEFDPDFHATDKDGKPIPTKAGGFRKKPGRKSGNLNSRKMDDKAKASQASEQIDEKETEEYKQKCISSAFAATQATVFGLGITLSMKPEKAEVSNLMESYEEYYKFAGPGKLPPWAGPVLVTASIINNHIEDEAPKTRIAKIKEWIGIRIHRWKNRKDSKK